MFVLDLFTSSCHLGGMPEMDKLRPASQGELTQALAFALQFHGRKRVHHADSFMARIAAERLVEYLRLSGFVVMKRPPLANHGAAHGVAPKE
jgi:hypothetical protein